MTLTQERAQKLADFLNADDARAKTLAVTPAEEAVEKINALGNDFTVEELQEFARAIEANSAQGELDANTLDSVAGGKILLGTRIGIRVAVIWATHMANNRR